MFLRAGASLASCDFRDHTQNNLELGRGGYVLSRLETPFHRKHLCGGGKSARDLTETRTLETIVKVSR